MNIDFEIHVQNYRIFTIFVEVHKLTSKNNHFSSPYDIAYKNLSNLKHFREK